MLDPSTDSEVSNRSNASSSSIAVIGTRGVWESSWEESRTSGETLGLGRHIQKISYVRI